MVAGGPRRGIAWRTWRHASLKGFERHRYGKGLPQQPRPSSSELWPFDFIACEGRRSQSSSASKSKKCVCVCVNACAHAACMYAIVQRVCAACVLHLCACVHVCICAGCVRACVRETTAACVKYSCVHILHWFTCMHPRACEHPRACVCHVRANASIDARSA